MECEQWRYGEGRLSLAHDGTIAVLEFTGLISATVLNRLIGFAVDRYGPRTLGWVSDFTGAALVVPLDELSRITLGTPAGHVLRRPGAFVVGEGVRAAMRAHSRAVSQAGIWRRTFTGRRTALEWLAQVLKGLPQHQPAQAASKPRASTPPADRRATDGA